MPWGEMSAREVPNKAAPSLSIMRWNVKKKTKTVSWCDNQENRIGVGGLYFFFFFFKLFECDQQRPAEKMIIHCIWISRTECTTRSWILLAPATDQITCFALLNHVPTFFPAYSPGLLPVMAVSVLVINDVTHLKVVIYKWPWHGIISFLWHAFCFCNKV